MRSPNNPSKWTDRFLHLLLFLLFFMPPLVFVPGRFQGQWIFVNYREPKLAAIQVLAWLFLTAFWWIVWKDPLRLQRLLAVAKDRWTWLLVAFVLYLCWTAHQAMVIEASFYELAQYWTLLNLYIALVVLWQEETYMRTALVAISASFVIVTAIGLYQLRQPISFLIPIPGPKNPSTLGYKNPAALAMLGQIFLLLSLISHWGQKGRWRLAVAGGLIALAEVAYLATLQSRTSYFAFAITMALVLGFSLCLLWRKRKVGILKIVGPVMLTGVMVFGWILVSYPPAQKRVQMTFKYFQEPAKFLTSDRGTYLRNSWLSSWSCSLTIASKCHTTSSPFLGSWPWLGRFLPPPDTKMIKPPARCTRSTHLSTIFRTYGAGTDRHGQNEFYSINLASAGEN